MSTSRVNGNAHESSGGTGDHGTDENRGISQDRGGDGRAAAAGRMDPELMRLAAILLVGAIAALLDTTIVNVAIRTIEQDLRAPLGMVQWVMTGTCCPTGW